MKCNKTQSKWCINKHGATKIIDTFETYHIHSFHARPCYIYNPLNMPGPNGIITVYGSFRKAKECEEGEAAFAEAMFFGEEFQEIHAATDPAEMPASKEEVFRLPAHLQADS
jgi:hypothetical protein